jgi:hypothetical protein
VVTAAVLAGHALLLLGLPLWNVAPVARTEVAAMQTRALALPQPPALPPAAESAPSARPAAPPRPRRQAAPRPAPEPAPLDTPIRETVEPLAGSTAAPSAPSAQEGATADAPAQAAAEAAGSAASQEAAPVQPAAAAAAPAAEGQARGMEVHAADGTPMPSGDALPIQLPDPARLSFSVTGQAKRFDYSANAELVWRHANGQYQASQEVSLFLLGSRSQSSEGRITDQGLEPGRFEDKARKLQTAQLDFGQQRAHFSAGTPDAVIAPGAQDRLSVFLQLSALLGAAPQRYPQGTQIGFITVSARRADRWTFRVGAMETLDLPAGSLQALRLDKVRQGADDQDASLWLAPSLQYLPVRIRLAQDNGDFADLQLKSRQAP